MSLVSDTIKSLIFNNFSHPGLTAVATWRQIGPV
jgi:hypothetical protein